MRKHALAAVLLVLSYLGLSAADTPVVGFLRVDAERYFAEERDAYPYAVRVLRPNGFGFGLGEWHQFFGKRVSPAATLDLLRQFHVTVIDTPFDCSITDLGPARRQTAATARQALETYLREGGSALLILQAVRYPGDQDQDFANLILQGLGLEMLHEGVFDPQHQFAAPIASIFRPEGFFRTESVTRGHAVTEGVTRLCLPQYHNGKTPGVVALRLSPEWQVLVRGEESAQSYVVTREQVTDYGQVGTHRSAPPIVAVRSFGKGRVMALSVPARNVHANYGVPGWNMIVESAGDAAANLPSDGGRLVLNGLRWLAETALANPGLGTFSAGAVTPVQFPPSIEWDKAGFPAPTAGVRGLIGARTALSDGSGTVADYVAPARSAGLSFIVFNEALEALTPDELAQLKQECQQASTGDFYACPGLEFGDELGNRWAIWSERVAYPQASFKRAYGETNESRPELRQWDGAVMHNPGQFWEYCAYAPNLLLTYRNLRAKGAHPANLWWFYRVPPYVYDGGVLVEDQLAEWRFALRDVRHLNPASFTRVRRPADVAVAAAVCATGGRDLATVRDWLNTRCGNFVHPACPYVTGGPVVEQWAAINHQHDYPFSVRGKQRARCRFQVSSPSGIREVIVHNADYGVERRFLGRGEATLAQEFEMVHDRDHALTLEVIDTQGRKAVSDKVLLFCYKTSLLRCGDNLNFLNGVGLCWHPDRNEMMPLAQGYQGLPVESIRGYDTAAALTGQVALRAWPIDSITTEELKQYPARAQQGILRKILDVVLPGNDVKICTMAMGPIVEPYDSLTRDTPARTSPPVVVEDNLLFRREHRAVYLQNRNNMFITWDHRRAREGAQDYRGGMVWHEGTIAFKRDATLAGGVPIMLFYFTPSGPGEGTATTLLVQDATGGPTAVPIPLGKTGVPVGTVAPGGFLTAAPCDTYSVFYAGAGTPFRYLLAADPKTGRVNQLQVGLGGAGQKVTAGTEVTYRFAMATLGGERQAPAPLAAQLADVGEGFGLGGGDRGVRTTVTVGKLVGREMFLTLQAEAGETSLSVQPRPLIIDLPIRLQGVEDNGCVAVYSTARPFFRFVGVAEGSAWFQENVDQGAQIWAGNVFRCDQAAVRLTLVCDGIGAGRPPFIEVHNPTAAAVQAVITSPPHAPRFGGLRLTAAVPAGASVVLPLPVGDQPAAKGETMKVQGESLVLAKTVPGNLCFDRLEKGSVVVRSTYLPGQAKTVVYREPVDYIVDYEKGAITRTEASAIPDFSKNMLYGQKDFDHTKFPGFTNHPYFIWVDYTTANGRAWAPPNDQTPYLAKTRAKLEAGGPFRIVSYGDSITAGGEASTPDLRFQAQFGRELQRRFSKAQIEVEDASISGYASIHGIQWWDKYIGKTSPDLVLVGWGMNDHNLNGPTPEQFRQNLVTLVGMIGEKKGAEVILFSAFPPNDDWHYGTHRMGLYADATRQAALDARCAYVDVWSIWARLLQRKDQSSLLGNNINHPNDFGHWLYAQAFAALRF